MKSKILPIGLLAFLLCGVAGGLYLFVNEDPVCQVCGRPIHQGTAYQILLQDGEGLNLCCPRCGLRFQETAGPVAEVWAADFETGEQIPAARAVYVENSSLQLCCADLSPQGGHVPVRGLPARDWDRCLPSLVAFKNRERAAQFGNRFGGVLKTYDQLLAESN